MAFHILKNPLSLSSENHKNLQKISQDTFNPPPLLQILKTSSQAKLSSQGSSQAAGHNLFSTISTVIPPQGKAIIPTGLSITILQGTYARIAPQSGLAVKSMIEVGAGVIDADFRSEVKVILFNHGPQDFHISPGDRIA